MIKEACAMLHAKKPLNGIMQAHSGVRRDVILVLVDNQILY